MIEVRNLRKTYADLKQGEIIALDGISFDAVEGEIFGLLGPNGAGKTTALRIISTILKPTAGSVILNGCNVVTQSEAARRQIGFVSTNTAMYDRMTAWEMVEYFGRLYDLKGDKLYSRMDDIFERLQMQEIRDLLGSKMSTGMKQKVSIARALVHNPPILIFDEATSGLDVLVARNLLEIVTELRDQGKCIILSTHIMREAERLCDKIAIMHKGTILTCGTLEELLGQHQDRDLEELFFQLISQHDESKKNSQPSNFQNDQLPDRLSNQEVV